MRIEFVEKPQVDPVARRLTLILPSLEVAEVLLAERGWSYERLSGISYTDRRLAAFDPAGNRVELKQGWPLL